jgi:hypothetical protein
MNASSRYVIVINAQRFEVDVPTLRPVQLRALAGIPMDHAVIVEHAGTKRDFVMTEDQSISLTEGPVYIYTRPPTSFGSVTRARR